MSLLDRLTGKSPVRDQVLTLDQYGQLLNQYQYQWGGLGYAGIGLQQTIAGASTERPADTFVGLASQAYAANGVVFACMLVRQLVFSSIRFQWQRILNGKPSETFGDLTLGLLEQPWPGGTTQDLLARAVQDADLAGNSYWYRDTSLARLGTQSPNSEMVRLRPDWVQVVGQARRLGSDGSPRGGGQVGWKKAGYLYTEGGYHPGNSNTAVAFTVDEVAHFAPIPDPLAVFTGMSWLTPILREIQADQAMTRHQRKFMDNGATPNMVVKHTSSDRDAIKKWAEELDGSHAGVDNAYKTLHLYPGAEATIVGANLKDIDFAGVREGGEVRIAAAAGVPPVIVGLSKGLDSATYSNYGQARRRLADGTAHPLWQNMAGSMQQILPPPGNGVRLWYDATDVPFLREDEADAANIAAVRASTINTYLAAGFTAESAVKAVDAGDINLLKHTGMTSVQLLPPGTPSKSAPSETNNAPPLQLIRRNSDGSTSLENTSA
ncbi:phage portal protein [Mycobacterium sp. SMC-13]|uniref:phage portal protein n=1 Tax=Mycobacterium sp. SMC-13 TaxID=3381626 RepID=UPI0038766266